MKISLIVRLLLLGCTALCCMQAHAAQAEKEKEKQKESSATSLLLDASLYHFSYQEFDDNGNLFSKEEGFLPGGRIGLKHDRSRFSFLASISAHGALANYTGQTQTGQPVTSRTRENIVDTSLLAEYRLETASGKQYGPYAGGGYHFWRRNVQPTAITDGILETYTWFYGLFGFKAEIFRSADTSILLDARVTRTFRPHVRFDFGGSYDNTDFKLGERWGGRLAMPIQMRNFLHGPQTTLQIEPYFERFNLGRSADHTLTQGGIATIDIGNEPDSRTTNIGINLGIMQSF